MKHSKDAAGRSDNVLLMSQCHIRLTFGFVSYCT